MRLNIRGLPTADRMTFLFIYIIPRNLTVGQLGSTAPKTARCLTPPERPAKVSSYLKLRPVALDTSQQFKQQIDRSQHALIALRQQWHPDAVASALALAKYLERKGKKADIVAEGFAAPTHLQFLPGIDRVRPGLNQLQKFVITLDVSQVGIDELSYDLVDNELQVFVTPKSGQFRPEHLNTRHAEFKYDLIITVDAPDFGSLGAVFHRHTDFFHHKPVINIDHDPANERYGNLNLVDIAASSAAEVLHQLLNDLGESAWDSETATCLLTGLIAKTRSFKTPRVTPRTLQIASELIAAGGQRDEIVRHLYRTRSLPTLKLWGRALSRLKHDPVSKFAWTLLVKPDFVHAGADYSQLADVMEELLVNSPEAEICGVLYEQPADKAAGTEEMICALICSDKHEHAGKLVADLKPEGDHRLARVCFPHANLIEAEKAVLNAVYKSLGKTAPYADTVTPAPAPELGHPELRTVKAERVERVAELTALGRQAETQQAEPATPAKA
jgi:nanoRNase/pAp phosphatase (c-di-AMP/oligoRNAs hydrolase)